MPVEKVDKPTENELSPIEHAKPSQVNQAETVDLNRTLRKCYKVKVNDMIASDLSEKK